MKSNTPESLAEQGWQKVTTVDVRVKGALAQVCEKAEKENRKIDVFPTGAAGYCDVWISPRETSVPARDIPKLLQQMSQPATPPTAVKLIAAPLCAAQMLYALNDAGFGLGYEGSQEEREIIIALWHLDRQLKWIVEAASRALPKSALCPSGSGVSPTPGDLVESLANLHSNLVAHVDSAIDKDNDWGPLEWETWNQVAKGLIKKEVA